MDMQPTRYQATLHPCYEAVKVHVHQVFVQEWNFLNDRARAKFLATDFPKLFCHVYPKAEPDRISSVCLLFTLLFLMDDTLESMSLEEGAKWYERLYPIARGEASPNHQCPDEMLMYSIWEKMRGENAKLSDLVLEPCFVFMRAQVAPNRNVKRSFGEYMFYRLEDIGTALIAKMGCFALDLDLTPAEHAAMLPLEENFGKHLLITNDVYSYDKEARAIADGGHPEGAAICSAVPILSSEMGLTPTATKRILMDMVREYEVQHFELADQLARLAGVASVEQLPTAVAKYVVALRDAAAGNEAWSVETMRYKVGKKAQMQTNGTPSGPKLWTAAPVEQHAMVTRNRHIVVGLGV